MNYSIKASSKSKKNGIVDIKNTEITFGTTVQSKDQTPNPAELMLGSLAACILKSVERFSTFMKFEYTSADITIDATRLEKPPRMDQIVYQLQIQTSDEKLNAELLQKNVEKFGTIYNTINASCDITGKIIINQLNDDTTKSTLKY